MTKIAILASYNGSGFSAIYEAIQKKKLHAEITLIISNNTDANVLQKAKKYSIPNYIVNSKTDKEPEKKLLELLTNSKCDIVFLSGYMKKLPSSITKKFTILNCHPSLLPKYGGAGMYGKFVHEAVIKNQEVMSGVSIHTVNEIYDDGKIILQNSLELHENETAQSLEERIKKLEGRSIIEALGKFLDQTSHIS